MARQKGSPLGLRLEKGVAQAIQSLPPKKGLRAARHASPAHSIQPGGSSCFNPQPFEGKEPPFLEIP